MHLIPIREVHAQSSTPVPAENMNTVRIHTPTAAGVSSALVRQRTSEIPSPGWPRGIARVPTHTVGRVSERRAYVRASLILPLSLRTVAGRPETELPMLSTQDISSSGIFFLCPRRIEPGTPIEMEVVLVDKPSGRGSVRMRTQASIVRAEESGVPGCYGLAAAFDDITFIRDEPLPPAQS